MNFKLGTRFTLIEDEQQGYNSALGMINPLLGCRRSGTAISALIPQTMEVFPNRTVADPSAEVMDPDFKLISLAEVKSLPSGLFFFSIKFLQYYLNNGK